MSEDTLTRAITAANVLEAMHLVVLESGDFVEAPEPVCAWPKLCGEICRFPRYFRNGHPTGLVSHVLLELGYPRDLLKQLDTEYEISEVLHPGVKIGRSRNAALYRVERSGRLLLTFLQERQKLGVSWLDISVEAVRPRRMIRYLDCRRRPWLY
jgi:hypothetical protein